jgi:signal transduction histidine kinase
MTFDSGIHQFFAAIASASNITITSSQIWALDTHGFHAVFSDTTSPDQYREIARQTCLYNTPKNEGLCCAIPFQLNEKQSGALVMGFDHQNPCTQQTLKAIEQHIHHTQSTLDELMSTERYARLSGTAQRADWMGKAISLAYELEKADDLHPIFERIHQTMKQLMYAENFFVIKLKPCGKMLSFAYMVDQFQSDLGDISLTEGILQGSFSAYVVKTGRLLRGSTLELSKQIGLESVSHYGEEARDWIGVPLMIGPERYGAIVVQIYDENVRFNDQDPNLLTLLADAMATSFHRRRITRELESQVEQRTKELEESFSRLKDSMAAQKSLQNQLVESKKQAALGRLVTGVAHELNTPLGVCTTASSVIDDRSKKLRQKFETNALSKLDLEHFIDTISDSSQLLSTNLFRACGLIERFKQVSAQQQPELVKWFNVNALMNTLKVIFSDNDIQVHCDTSIKTYSCPIALTRVLEQLIENSITHGFNGKTQGLITINIQQLKDWIEINYEDNGVGIDPSIAAKAFDPFVTTSRNSGNVGIGLHIIANTVTQTLKGTLCFCDKADNGVKLQVRFPVNAKAGK